VETWSVPALEVGILTKGKPTLGLTLGTLLLQQGIPLRVYVVDTAEKPTIQRDDVLFTLKLAQERGIPCDYEYLPEKDRAFSLGRLKLLEGLSGEHLCFLDDDIALPSGTLFRVAEALAGVEVYGFCAPTCRNSPGAAGQYVPGSIFYADERVRHILTEYYATTTDLLDRGRSRRSVWEIAFLCELFLALGRPCISQPDNVIYHLDYHEAPHPALFDDDLLIRSRTLARELARKYGPPDIPSVV